MPAFAAFHDQFVPRDPAAQWLVCVGDEPGHPVIRLFGRDGKSVGAKFRSFAREGEGQCQFGLRDRRPVFPGQFAIFRQSPDYIVELEEEWLPQREAGGNVHGIDREQPVELQLGGMRGGIVVEAAGIGVEDWPHICRQLFEFAFGNAPGPKQVVDIIHWRTRLARDRPITPAGHGEHILQGEEIILCMGPGNAIGHVHVSGAIDVGDAIVVTDDFG